MTRIEFNQLVQKVEEKYSGRPDSLRNKSLWMALGGFSYMALVFILALAALIGVITLVILYPKYATIKIAIAVGLVAIALLLSIGQGLVIRLGRPEGIQLVQEDCPKLFELINELREKVADAKFDRVLIDDQFNASVCQTPRLGILGWYQSDLTLGLPLMQSLDPEEFRAVLAHEFAHLSNKDGTSGTWLYRVRRSWSQIIDAIGDREHKGSWALIPFIDWFWPRFNAHAFVLSRLQEYRADAASADFTSKEVAGRTLQRVKLRGAWLSSDFWPQLYGRIKDESIAPTDVYSKLREESIRPIPAGKQAQWLKEAFLRPTSNADTHPSLTHRMQALEALPPEVMDGNLPAPLPEVEQSAASFYLKDKENELTQQLDKDWTENMTQSWLNRHMQIQEVRKELGSEDEVKDAETAWDWAVAINEIEGAGPARQWIDKTLEFDPNHFGARYLKASSMLEQDNEAGIQIVEDLMKESVMFSEQALGFLEHYYTRTGQVDKLNEIAHRADEHDRFKAAVDLERQKIEVKDNFVSCGLSQEEIQKLIPLFEKEDDLFQVYLVRKETELLQDVPMFVLCLVVKPPAMSFRKEEAGLEIANRLYQEIELDGTKHLFIHEKEMKKVGKKIMQVPEALIYERMKK